MPSYGSLYITALTVSHIIGIGLFLYAIQQNNGALSYWWWLLKYSFVYKRRYKGDFKKAWYDTYPGAKKAHDEASPAVTSGDPLGYKNEEADKFKGVVHPEPEASPAYMEEMPEPAELTWTDLTYCVKAGNPPRPKTVLQKCSGTLKPGESVALMGPSGAGKSSLLDLLAGRKLGKGIRGSVTVNGRPVTTETSGQYFAYVAQEDVFVASLSVWEALLFYTELSLPGEFNGKQREGRMRAVLRTMGLDKVTNSRVGGVLAGGIAIRGISGGEKRRLSIACGLVANPSILFLDEPTTGLDSHAALNVMKHLISLTDSGLTIIASIHQPRQAIFDRFAQVIVLSEGYQMFLAPPEYALHWFQHVLEYPYDAHLDGTVADWLITVISITFAKRKSGKKRSMESVEEVQQAAYRFASLQTEAEKDGEEMHADILETPNSQREGTGISGAEYRSAINSWLTTSMANASLLKERETVNGGSANPDESDHKIAVALPDMPDIMDTFETLPYEDEPALQRKYPRSLWVQYKTLFRRSLLGTLRNPAECAVRLLVNVWVAMLAGLVYIRLPDNANSSSSRLAAIFVLTMTFQMAPFSYMSFYFSDRRFFLKDSANGLYAPSAYQAAALHAGIPFVAMNTCLSTLTFYGLTGLRYEWRAILITMALLTLHALVAQQFAIFAVWITSSQDGAYAISSTYMVLNLLLLGFYIRTVDMTLSVYKGLTWAMFSKYTYQGLAANEFKNRAWDLSDCTQSNPGALSGGAVPICQTPGNAILDYYGFKLKVDTTASALLGFWGLFCAMSYFALLKMYRTRV